MTDARGTRAWQKFVELYLSIDRRVLGAFRIVYGLVLLHDLLRRAAVLDRFYTNDGVLSNHYVLYRPQQPFQFSLLDDFSTPSEAGVAFALIGLVYVLYTLGLFTRLAQPLALLALTSLNARNLFLENDGVTAAIALGIWTAFLPVGERLSLDALRAEAGFVRTSERVAWRARARVPAVSLAVLAVTLQLCAIYWLNATHQTGDTWRDGEALHYLLWQRRGTTELGAWLAGHEPAWFSPLAGTVLLALWWLVPLLALTPWSWSRLLSFFMALLLNAGLGLLLGLDPFPLVALALAVLRLPWPALAALRRLWPRRVGLRAARWRARTVSALQHGALPWLRLRRSLSPRRALLGPLHNGLVLLLLVISLLDLAAYLRAPERPVRPLWLRAATGYPRFFQRWSLLPSDVPRSDGMGLVDATTRGGRHVDPFTGLAPETEPFDTAALPGGSITADYLYQLHLEKNRPYWPELLRHLREWHEHDGRSTTDRIGRVELWWLTRDSPPPGSTATGPVKRELVFRERP